MIADILDKSDDAKGRAVAATGTIASGGAIGPVGGVEEKAIAAREAGAKILLVPDQELPSAANGQIDVVGVKTLQQALDFLRGSSGGS